MIERNYPTRQKGWDVSGIFSAEHLTTSQMEREAHFRDWLVKRAAIASGAVLFGMLVVGAVRGESAQDEQIQQIPPAVEVSVSPAPTDSSVPGEAAAHALQANEHAPIDAYNDPVLAAINAVTRTM